MLNNSIIDNLTKVDIISTIKLELSADIQKKSFFLILEGDDDLYFFRKFMRTANVSMYESYSGCEGVFEIVANEFSGTPNIIGVIDRDYGSNYKHEKIFYYDYNCLEMMILNSTDTFRSVVSELWKEPVGCSINELRYQLLKNISFLGALRKLNNQKQWNICFRCLQFSHAYIAQTKLLDIKIILAQLVAGNSHISAYLPDLERVANESMSKTYSLDELLSLTQGHDFNEYFYLCLKPQNSNNFSKTTIPIVFRCTFQMDHFLQTQLWNSLSQYILLNNLSSILI